MHQTKRRLIKHHRTKRRLIKHHQTKRHRTAKGINLDITDNKGYTLRDALRFYSEIITEYKFYNNKEIKKLIDNINKIINPSNTNFKATPSLLYNIKMVKKLLKRLSYQNPPISKTTALKHLLELLDKQIQLGSRPKIRRSDPRRSDPVYKRGRVQWDPKAIRIDTFIHSSSM